MESPAEDVEATPTWLSDHNEDPDGVDAETETGAGTAAVNDDANKKPSRKRMACARILSCLVLAAFIYSTVVQYNDIDKFLWSCYYGLQASLAALFLVWTFWAYRGIERIIYALGATLVVWSLVMIAINVINLKNILKEDNPDADEREEYIFEVTGVSLGCFCALYHLILTMHLAKGVNRSEG